MHFPGCQGRDVYAHGQTQVMPVLTSWPVEQFTPIAFQLFVCRNAILLLFAGASFPITSHLSFLRAAGLWICWCTLGPPTKKPAQASLGCRLTRQAFSMSCPTCTASHCALVACKLLCKHESGQLYSAKELTQTQTKLGRTL